MLQVLGTQIWGIAFGETVVSNLRLREERSGKLPLSRSTTKLLQKSRSSDRGNLIQRTSNSHAQHPMLSAFPKGVGITSRHTYFGNLNLFMLLQLVALIGSVLISINITGTPSRPSPSPLHEPTGNYGFEPWNEAYLVRTPLYDAIIDTNGIGLLLADGNSARIDFKFSSENARVMVEGRRLGVVNYYLPPERGGTRTGIPRYEGIRIHDLYDGIDLKFKLVESKLSFDVLMSPGSSEEQILIDLGAEAEIHDHRIVLSDESGVITMSAPFAYTDRGDPVAADYVRTGSETFGLKLGERDTSLGVTIDPTIEYSTLLGGSDGSGTGGVGVDRSGNAYIAGATTSRDFPTTSRAVQRSSKNSNTRSHDGFVAKFNVDGSGLAYSTYFGGSNDDFLTSMAVDSDGNAYITGRTSSSDFPTTSHSIKSGLAGETDAVAVKLTSEGALEYSTYIGGSGREWGRGIAIDNSGHAYLVGETQSLDFPTSSGAYLSTNPSTRADHDAVFVAKIDPLGSRLEFATYLGGSAGQWGVTIAVGSDFSVYVAGRTQSEDFPTTDAAVQRRHNGQSDAFVTRMDPSGRDLMYSTLLGGSSPDAIYGIALDSTGNAYVAGTTQSMDFPAAEKMPLEANPNGGGFAAKINSDGTALEYSNIIGGSQADWSLGIAVDSLDRASVVGWTSSSDMPTTGDAVQPQFPGGDRSSFIVRLDREGRNYDFATFFGGSGDSEAAAVATFGTDLLYVSGSTRTGDIPLFNAYIGELRGDSAAYLLKLDFSNRTHPPRSMTGGGNSYFSWLWMIVGAILTATIVGAVLHRRRQGNT